LLSLYHYQPSNKILNAARQCADHLLERAETMPHGIAWKMRNFENKTLGGFAHGTTGIAWALLELASVSGEAKYRTAALQAIEYDRSLSLRTMATGWMCGTRAPVPQPGATAVRASDWPA
jgi:lantibiotic modifying enzyme